MYDFRHGVVCGFSHGHLRSEPGTSNLAMIEGLKREGLLGRMPLLLQQELADAAQLLSKFPNIVHRVTGSHAPENYLGMKEVAEQFVPVVKEHGWRTVYVLAYPGLGWLHASMLLKKMLGSTIAVRPLWRIWYVPSDPESLQWWTRTWWGPYLYAVKKFITGKSG